MPHLALQPAGWRERPTLEGRVPVDADASVDGGGAESYAKAAYAALAVATAFLFFPCYASGYEAGRRAAAAETEDAPVESPLVAAAAK
mgnify:CR=1 FL=1